MAYPLRIPGKISAKFGQGSGGGSSLWTQSGNNIYYDTGIVIVGDPSGHTPTYDLEVYNGAGYAQMAIISEGDSTTGALYNLINDAGEFITATLAGSTHASTYFGLSWASLAAWTTDAAGGLLIGTSAATSLSLGTNSTVKMTIESGGDVGIGSASPNELLHVGAGTTGPSNTTGYEGILISSASLVPQLALRCESITAEGGLFMHSGGVLYMGTWTNHDVEIRTNNTRLMFFDASTSRVGINTASPGYSLEVSGTGRFTGSLNVGDGTGAAAFVLNGVAGNYRITYYRTNGSQRFIMGVNNTAESGSDAGSNFYIARYSDAAAYLGTPFFIERSTGYVAIGGTASLNDILNVYTTTNGAVGVFVQNPNTGTSAYTRIRVANVVYSGEITFFGSNYSGTYNGVSVYDMLALQNTDNSARGVIIAAAGSNPIYLGTNSTIRMVIEGGGNVGIGTSSVTNPAGSGQGVQIKSSGYSSLFMDGGSSQGGIVYFGRSGTADWHIRGTDVLQIIETSVLVHQQIANDYLYGRGSSGRYGYAEATGVAGTAVDLISDGNFDCANHYFNAMYIVEDSAGSSNLGRLELNSSGDTNVVLTAVGNQVTFTMNANGSVSVQRTNGSRTYSIVVWYIGY